MSGPRAHLSRHRRREHRQVDVVELDRHLLGVGPVREAVREFRDRLVDLIRDAHANGVDIDGAWADRNPDPEVPTAPTWDGSRQLQSSVARAYRGQRSRR